MIDDFPSALPDDLGRVPGASGSTRRSDWLPVAPAAHYLSGGVVTDLDGATTLPHLWACGEAACSGVHGANRLASNSLLDGLVFGRRVVEAIVAGKDGAESTGAMAGVLELAPTATPTPTRSCCRKDDATDPDELRGAVQRAMSADCGVVRDADGLQIAAETLARSRDARRRPSGPRRSRRYEVVNLLRVSRGDRRGGARRARSRAARTRAPTSPTPTTRCSAGSSHAGGRRRVFVALPGVRRGSDRVSDVRSAPRRRAPTLVAHALAEDLGVARRHHVDRVHRRGPDRRRPRSSPARRACSRAPRSRPRRSARSTTTSTCEWHVARRRRGRGRRGARPRSRVRCASILTGERVALNFLCHCSGVATLTRRYVRAARGKARILDTRKTLPGLRARADGGGARRRRLQPPRLAVATRCSSRTTTSPRSGIAEAVERARARWPGRIVEVECDTLDQVAEARDAGADLVLLDNMTPEEVARGGRDPSTGACQGRGVGRHHARDGRRVRRDRRRLHLGRRAHALGAACSTSASTSR